MPNIQSYKNINVDNLVFGFGEYNGNYCTIKLNYRSDKENDYKHELLIQAPKMSAPFGISSYENNSLNNHLDLSFGDLGDDLQEFYELIENINKKCKRKRKKWKITNQQFSNNLKINSRFYPPILRTKIPMLNNRYHFNVFDDYKNKINYDDITANSICTPIIHIKNVWINESNYGITIQLIQLKIHISKMLEDYSFIDEEQNSNNYNNVENIPKNIIEKNEIDNYTPLKEHSDYGQYFKMLRYKIPKESVLNKMRFNNHDIKILDLDENKSLEIQTKNVNNNTELISSNDLLAGMKNLKKPQKIEKPIQKVSNAFIKPPSAADLLNARKKLKKKPEIEKII